MIETKRLIIEDLKREDVDSLMKWNRNTDLLIKEYDFIDATNGNPDLWYKYRIEKSRLKSYTVKNKANKVIGFISIRDINKLMGSATLGITFNEDYLGQGYGTEALKAFLNYYFFDLNMKTMLLDVGKYNFRAIKCYKNLGFSIKKEIKVILEEQFHKMAEAIKSDPEQIRKETFIPFGNSIILIYYKMKLKKRDFIV